MNVIALVAIPTVLPVFNPWLAIVRVKSPVVALYDASVGVIVPTPVAVTPPSTALANVWR